MQISYLIITALYSILVNAMLTVNGLTSFTQERLVSVTGACIVSVTTTHSAISDIIEYHFIFDTMSNIYVSINLRGTQDVTNNRNR